MTRGLIGKKRGILDGCSIRAIAISVRGYIGFRLLVIERYTTYTTILYVGEKLP